MTVGIPEGVAERIGKAIVEEMVRAGEMARNGLKREAEHVEEIVVRVVDIHKVEVHIRKGPIPASTAEGLGEIKHPHHPPIDHDAHLQAVAKIHHPQERYLDFNNRKDNLHAFYRKSPMLEHEYKSRLHQMAKDAAEDLFPLTDLNQYQSRRDWLKHLMNQSPMTEPEFTAFANRLKQQAVDEIFANRTMSYDKKRDWLTYVNGNSPMTSSEYSTLSRRLMEQAMAGNGVR